MARERRMHRAFEYWVYEYRQARGPGYSFSMGPLVGELHPRRVGRFIEWVGVAWLRDDGEMEPVIEAAAPTHWEAGDELAAVAKAWIDRGA
jgi:hypothetical protein